MTNKELLSRATQFDLGRDPNMNLPGEDSHRIFLSARSHQTGKKRKRTVQKWVITDDAGYLLNKQGKWEYEPLPTWRTEAFKVRTRFKTIESALKLFEKWKTKAEKANEDGK